MDFTDPGTARTIPWLPLAGQNLFLSVQRRRINELELQKYIQALGGKVETFFSNEITCVLTDELPQIATNKSQQTPLSNIRSIISKAETLGIQIVKIETFLTWLHIHAGYPVKQQSKVRSLKPTNKVTKLSGHYIKVEDNDQKYCPIYKVYPDQPRVEFEDLFLKPSEFEVLESVDPATRRGFWKNSEDVRKHLAQKEVVKFSSSVISSKPTIQRQSRKYCECCKMYFSCLEKHLKGPRHTKYLANQDNFKELALLSNNVPDISAFQRKHSKHFENRSQNTDADKFNGTCDENFQVKPEPIFITSAACVSQSTNIYDLPLTDYRETTKEIFSYKTKEELDFRSFLGSDVLPDNERLFTSDESDSEDLNNSVFKLIETALQEEPLVDCNFSVESTRKVKDESEFLNSSCKVPVEEGLYNGIEVPNVSSNGIFVNNFCLGAWSVKPISDVKMSFLKCSVIPSLDVPVNCASPKNGNWRVKAVQDTKMTFTKVAI